MTFKKHFLSTPLTVLFKSTQSLKFESRNRNCFNFSSLIFLYSVYSWKLGRTKDGLSEESNARIDEIVYEKVDLFQGYYENTDQSLDACFHYPTFDNPPYIRLTGPCNDTIVGISNFNIDAVSYF